MWMAVFGAVATFGTGWALFVRHYATSLTSSIQNLTLALDTHAKHIDTLRENTIVARARIESIELRLAKIEDTGCNYSKNI